MIRSGARSATICGREWFDREHWEQFERIPRTWSALYQQKPAPETGDLLRSRLAQDL